MTSIATPGAELPIPAPASIVEFPSLDGTPLSARLWAHPSPRGMLLISHGLGEHGGSYRPLAEALRRTLDLDVLAFDYRGSGRSPGKRGVIRDYEDLILDLDAANRWAQTSRPGLPRFIIGHSNGGLVSIRTVLERNLGLSGLILSNPSIRVSAHAPKWKVLIARILLRLAPWITLETGLTNDQLTHDPAIMAEIESDPLRHSRISPPMYFGMRAAGRLALERAPEIRVPILMLIGGSDPIVDPEAGRQFFQSLRGLDKTLKLYPEMRHEPLNEIGRAGVIADVVAWLGPRLKTLTDDR